MEKERSHPAAAAHEKIRELKFEQFINKNGDIIMMIFSLLILSSLHYFAPSIISIVPLLELPFQIIALFSIIAFILSSISVSISLTYVSVAKGYNFLYRFFVHTLFARFIDKIHLD